jgi:hypothetical protein
MIKPFPVAGADDDVAIRGKRSRDVIAAPPQILRVIDHEGLQPKKQELETQPRKRKAFVGWL